jgi:hypothetical protein
MFDPGVVLANDRQPAAFRVHGLSGHPMSHFVLESQDCRNASEREEVILVVHRVKEADQEGCGNIEGEVAD